MTATRWSKRIRKVQLSKTTSSSIQSYLRKQRQLYFLILENKCQNIISRSRMKVSHRLCEKLRGGTKWLYEPVKSYDKRKKYRSTTWREVFCDLCGEPGGGAKHLYGVAESGTEWGSGVAISRGQRTRESHFSFGSSSMWSQRELWFGRQSS